jgi:hypothetical protein
MPEIEVALKSKLRYSSGPEASVELEEEVDNIE